PHRVRVGRDRHETRITASIAARQREQGTPAGIRFTAPVDVHVFAQSTQGVHLAIRADLETLQRERRALPWAIEPAHEHAYSQAGRIDANFFELRSHQGLLAPACVNATSVIGKSSGLAALCNRDGSGA